MPVSDTGNENPWFSRWLDAVQDGSATMSQRTRASIEKNGGLPAAVAAATARGVHLVELTDDKGATLIAASRHPFTSLC